MTLAPIELGRRVLRVEDWAEIRRLHRAEQMPIKAIARLLGVLEEHGEDRDRLEVIDGEAVEEVKGELVAAS